MHRFFVVPNLVSRGAELIFWSYLHTQLMAHTHICSVLSNSLYMATYFLLLCTIWAHPAKETQGADWAVLAKVRFSSAPSVKGLRTQPDSINLCLDKAGP
jgi:hypothetical protein